MVKSFKTGLWGCVCVCVVVLTPLSSMTWGRVTSPMCPCNPIIHFTRPADASEQPRCQCMPSLCFQLCISLRVCWMYSFPVAAMTNYDTLSGFNNTNLCSRHSGSQESEISATDWNQGVTGLSSLHTLGQQYPIFSGTSNRFHGVQFFHGL